MRWPLTLGALAGPFAMVLAASGSELWQTMPEPPALPALSTQGYVEHDGARIWFATVGTGSPVLLLHGGLGSADNWGNQVPILVSTKHRVVLLDIRGHGRSARDSRPMSYELMESDVVAVMNELNIRRAAIVGWSDGGIIGLVMALKHPSRVASVFAFGASMDLHATRPDAMSNPIVPELIERAKKQYARLSPTPGDVDSFIEAMEAMWRTQPNYTPQELKRIRGVMIAIADADHEEFVTRQHTEYLARTIPGARLIILKGVSHFAPFQDPAQFNAAMLGFLASKAGAP